MLFSEHPTYPTDVDKMKSIRVLVKISRESSYFDTAWMYHDDLILAVVTILEEQGMIHKDTHKDLSSLLAVAIDRYDTRIFFVFDIYNLEYNFGEAHLPGKNNLPVIAVSLSQKGNSTYTMAGPMANIVNENIRSLHNLNGTHGELPFREDHANGCWPSYSKPRNCTAITT